jgi:hypothetical protein
LNLIHVELVAARTHGGTTHSRRHLIPRH